MTDKAKTKNMIIAISNPRFAGGIKSFVDNHTHYRVIETVIVLDHLIEHLVMLDQENTSIDAILIASDIAKKQEDKRLEHLADILQTIREHEKFSHISFAVLASEKPGHPFLAELVALGIYNITLRDEKDETIELRKIISTLDQYPTLSEVAHYRSNVDKSIPWRRLPTSGNAIRIDIHKQGGKEPSPKTPAKEVQIVEKEKVVEKVIEKVVEVKIPEMITLTPKMIAIGSLFPGAGSTFILSNLAKAIAESKIPVAILECVGNNPIWYELLFGMKNAPHGWESFATQIRRDKQVRKETVWKEESIVWVPLETNFSSEDWTVEETFYLLSSTRQVPLVLVDISSDWNTEMKQVVLNQADEIWIVATSSPSRVNTSKHRLEEFRNYKEKTYVIGNQWDDFIEKKDVEKEWLDSLTLQGEKEFELLTRISRYGKEVTEAEWEGKCLYDLNTEHMPLRAELYPMLLRLVPKQLLREPKKQDSLFARLMAGKRRNK